MELVPNVPCGVESGDFHPVGVPDFFWFLMYRVELKDFEPQTTTTENPQVPNVPCGVERFGNPSGNTALALGS